MKSGIYVIENLVNGKKYIGRSKNLKKRIYDSHKGCVIIENAFSLYGEENFSRKVLIYCEYWQLGELEKQCIKIYGSHISENGYNLSWGGDAFFENQHHSDKSKKQISLSLSGRTRPDEVRNKISKSRKGMVFSNEHKENLSKSRSGNLSFWFGKSLSKEHSEKIGASQIGEKHHSYGKKSNRKNLSSKYFGVSKSTIRKKYVYWNTYITVNREKIFIGSFKTEFDAAKAYDKYVIENNVNRPLNFIDDLNV